MAKREKIIAEETEGHEVEVHHLYQSKMNSNKIY